MKKLKTTPAEATPQLSLFPETTCDLLDLLAPLEAVDGVLEGPDPSPQFIASVRHLGILVPLIVQETPDGYKVLAGIRRLKAARVCQLKEIPIRVIPAGFPNPEVVTLQENGLRTSNPISEYRAIKSLIAKGYEVSHISKELGLPAAVVKQRLTLDGLNETLLGLAESGHIAPSVALQAAKLPEKVQAALVVKFEEKDSLSGTDVSEAKKVVLSDKTKASLGSLFTKDDKRKGDAKAAIQHLASAEELLKANGVEVDFASLRSQAEQLLQ